MRESGKVLSAFTVRPARTTDISAIHVLTEPLVHNRILLGKDRVVLYESVQEFRVAVDATEKLIGCGALHVMWEDLGEIRTLAVAPQYLRTGVGHALVTKLENDARELGLTRLFCLTFEVEFFSRRGFRVMDPELIDPYVYAELVRSPDEGVAEFLDLARVKPNILGNTRMIKNL